MSKRNFAILIAVLTAVIAGIWLLNRFYLNPPPPPLPEKEFVDRLLGGSSVKVKPPKEVQVILTGDIMLSRNVGSAIKKAANPDLPFEKLKAYLHSSDLNFGNLESPFSGSNYITPSGSLVFNVPPEYIKGLKNFNFQILSLANNHALDQGKQGLAYTKQLLSDNGIAGIGAGGNPEEAWQPAEMTIKNTKLCFIAASYASVNDGGKFDNGLVARTDDLETLKSVIGQMKTNGCNIIIAGQHAGTEYTHVPNQAQIDFAHAAIDAGANVVVGHHPHWVQPVEKYCPKAYEHPPLTSPIKGGENSSSSLPLVGRVREGETQCGLIFYSLGNFIFDQEWSQKTKEGLTVRLTIKDKQLESAELVPIMIENYCCARLADEKETLQILRDINATSTNIKL